MADNIKTQAGAGVDPDVATDEIGGAHYQKVKIALGAENALDTLVDSGQQTMANSVPVVIASDQTAVPVAIVSGGGAPAQYVEGDVDTTIAGTALLWEDAGDTLRPVSTARPLPVTVGAGLQLQGVEAHDSPIAGNPILLAGIAETPDDSVPGNQSSAEGDATRLATDRDGALYTHPHPPRIWHAAAEYTAQQTDATVKASPGAGLCLYVTDVFVACNGAVDVTLEEGTATLKFKYYASGKGDGVAQRFGVPLKLAPNTALTVTTSGSVSVTLCVSGFTGP